MIVDTLLTIVVATLFIAIWTAVTIGVGLLCLRFWQRLLSAMTSPVTDDRILYWPVALAILWPLLFVLLWLFFEMSPWWGLISIYFSIIGLISVYFSAIMALGLATMWIGSVIVACRLMIQWAVARHWRTALSTLVLPLGFLLVLLSSPLLWRLSDSSTDYVRFFVNYPYYIGQLEKRTAAKPQFMVWTSGDAYDDSAVLYDESDEVASDHPSEAWKKKAKAEGVVCCKHRHIMGHFYWVEFDAAESYGRH